MLDQITATAAVRIICNAYLYSCIALMGFGYLGYWVLSQLEKSPKPSSQSHWFS